MDRLKLTDCELDLRDGRIWCDAQPTNTRLNDVLFRLLMILVEHPCQDIPHDRIRRVVWEDRLDRETSEDRKQKMRKVYIAITRLRRALRDDARPYRHILSSRSGTYRFEPLQRAQLLGPAPSAQSRPTP